MLRVPNGHVAAGVLIDDVLQFPSPVPTWSSLLCVVCCYVVIVVVVIVWETVVWHPLLSIVPGKVFTFSCAG